MCKVTDFGMARNANQDEIYTRKSRVRDEKNEIEMFNLN